MNEAMLEVFKVYESLSPSLKGLAVRTVQILGCGSEAAKAYLLGWIAEHKEAASVPDLVRVLDRAESL